VWRCLWFVCFVCCFAVWFCLASFCVFGCVLCVYLGFALLLLVCFAVDFVMLVDCVVCFFFCCVFCWLDGSCVLLIVLCNSICLCCFGGFWCLLASVFGLLFMGCLWFCSVVGRCLLFVVWFVW